MFTTMLRLRRDCISGFKSSFGDSAPLPASGLFLFKCDAEASFLLSQVSYLCMVTFVGPSLTPVLFPGSSLSRGRGLGLFSRCSLNNLPLPADCFLSTQIEPLNLFGPNATSIPPSNLAGKLARRSNRWATLSTSGNAN